MAIIFSNGKISISDAAGDMVEVGDAMLTANASWMTPREPALPCERWCRYCGGSIDGDASWRMSCEPCWEQNAPSAFSAARIYGMSILNDSVSNNTFLSLISSA